jgi:hypothetical protein
MQLHQLARVRSQHYVTANYRWQLRLIAAGFQAKGGMSIAGRYRQPQWLPPSAG